MVSLLGRRVLIYRMIRVINPKEIIDNYLQQQLIEPLKQEHRMPSAEEIHDSIMTAAATLLINLDDIGEYCFETERKVTGSDIKVISSVVSEMDEMFRIGHPDSDYQKMLVDKQEQLLKKAKESRISIIRVIE